MARSLTAFLRAAGDPIVDLAAYVTTVAAIAGEAILAAGASAGRLRPVVREVLWRQVYFTAVTAVPFTSLLAFLVALAVAAQSPYSAAAGGNVLGTILVAALVRELAPVTAATIVIARSGTAMAAELATMRVEGEVDALSGMGIEPLDYLVVPRVIGTAISLLGLTVVFLAVSLGASAVLSPLLGGPPPRALAGLVAAALRPSDPLALLAKTLVPGMAVAAIACTEGLRAGRSTTRIPPAVTAAVVRSFTLVFVWNAAVSALVYLA